MQTVQTVQNAASNTAGTSTSATGSDVAAPIRVMILDDHAVVRKGLRAMLEAGEAVEVVAEAGCLAEAQERLVETRPDVVLLDIQLADNENGITFLSTVRRLSPRTAVIVLSAFLTPALLQTCLDAGASGYLVKDTKRLDLVGAVRVVANGGQVFDASVRDMERRRDPSAIGSLTPRELEVLNLLCRGLSNGEIGEQIGLSENAVKGFVSSVMKKFGCKNRVQVVLKAKEERLC